MQLLLPNEVISCLKSLKNAGFEAWCVGGAVRDMIMSRTPGDFDVTTSARPENVTEIFNHTVPTGIKHGTVTVIINKMPIEVTTYRSDGKYSDHRAPDSVRYVSSVDDDLRRRDFTVNAVCCSEEGKIYDPLNGVADICSKKLRTVGEPEKRFSEDALRIMRLFRFSSQLCFEIEEKSYEAAIKLSYLLKEISAERIRSELKKTFCGGRPTSLDPLLLCGALEFTGLPSCPVGSSIPDACPAEFALRFAFYCKQSRTDAKAVLKNLKSDNKTAEKADIYLEMLSMPHVTRCDIKRLLKTGGAEMTENLLRAYGKPCDIIDSIIQSGEPYNKSMLKIDGSDIALLGIKGPMIGAVIDDITDAVIDDFRKNYRDELIKMIKTKYLNR